MIGEPKGHYCWVKQCPQCEVTNYGCVAAIYCGSCGARISASAYNEHQYWGQPGLYYGAGDGIQSYFGGAGDGYYGYASGKGI